MPGLGLNLTNSVANVRRKLLEMMDALAETGMRHAHKEISRAAEITPVKERSPRKTRKRRGSGAVH
jgi:hypothetical protein